MFVDEEKLHRIGGVKAVGVAALALLLIGGGVGWMELHPAQAAAPLPVGETIDPPAPPAVLVFVSGAVMHAGLYQLSPDARVADAIAAAGGITSLANPGRLPNMAARVHDGRQINVPFLTGTSNTAAKLDINTAAEDELAAVPGMPAGLATQIVQYRQEWGQFTTMSQLRTDLGVDSATVAGLEKYLRVVLPVP